MRGWGLGVVLAAATLVGGCDGQLPTWAASTWTWAQKQVAALLGPAKPPSTVPAPQPVSSNGYKGTVQAEWLTPPKAADYFRDMKLLAPFGFVDPDGKQWDVPAGYVTNGASVPWGLWNLVGGPYDGPYRDAAVIHDYFCEMKTRPWEEVHKMFYDAAKARGISESLASTMYAAVRFGGPRWEVVGPVAQNTTRSVTPTDLVASSPGARRVDPGLTRGLATKSQQQQFDDLQKWIQAEKPSLADIEKRVEQLRQQNGMPTAPGR